MRRRKYRVWGLIAVLPVLGAGCGGPSAKGSSGDSDGRGAAAGAGGGEDAGESGAGGQMGGDVPANGPVPALLLEAFGGPPGYIGASVTYLDPNAEPPGTCSVPVKKGSCQLTACKFDVPSPTPASPQAGNPDLGPISASVGSITEQVPYERTGYGSVDFASSVTLDAGGTMTFRGEGGADGPMFDISATIPELGLITSPKLPSGGGAAIIDTSGDLSVTWAPISTGRIDFELLGGPLGGHDPVLLTCKFDGASGTGVVPQQLLSSMKELSGDRPAFADLASVLDVTTVVDGLVIETLSHQNSEETTRNFLVSLE